MLLLPSLYPLVLLGAAAASVGAPVPAEPAPGCVAGVECLNVMSFDQDGSPFHQPAFAAHRAAWPHGFEAFRIPAIVSVKQTLFAFAEAYPLGGPMPVNPNTPHGDCWDVMRREHRLSTNLYKPFVFKTSRDFGRSWSELQLVLDPSEAWPAASNSSLWDPTPVVDERTGTIHLVFSRMYHDADVNRPCNTKDWCAWTGYDPCPYSPRCKDMWVTSSSDLVRHQPARRSTARPERLCDRAVVRAGDELVVAP